MPAPRTGDTPTPDLSHLRYVAIEGVIGAGKTSLARMLAERMGARLVLEQFEENPFLPAFYEDRGRWAFQTELSFLASRFRQQKALENLDLFHNAAVSDYTFDKNRIFAHITLEGDELQLYESLYSLMEPNTPQPDLVVYLQSSLERLMANIALRARSYEQRMEREYLRELGAAYDQYFAHYRKGPLLVVNSSRIDFVNNPAHFDSLLSRIATTRQPGTTYFNPMAASAQLELL
jgi:deoxyguanosine kinase